MKKADRITQFVEQLGAADASGDSTLDPHYRGFFQCFNEQRYYEAHDVLEHLWLQNRDENFAYFKGLIQVAGAFVHLQKQFLRPAQPKDGRRLRPAVRLFHLGMKNIEPFGPRHMDFDVKGLHALCAKLAAQIAASDFAQNPWSPESAPKLELRK
jgi:predicted metal-dependent hydrolase